MFDYNKSRPGRRARTAIRHLQGIGYLVLPMLTTSSVSVFVSLYDTAVVARLGAAPLAGVAISASVLAVVSEVMFGLVLGYRITAAHLLGADERQEAANLTGSWCVSGILIGAGFALIALMIGLAVIHFVSLDPTVTTHTWSYMQWRILGLPAFAVSSVLSLWLYINRQRKWPMIAAFVNNAVNVVVTWVLVFGVGPAPNMGVAGAAIGTVVASYTGLFVVTLSTAYLAPTTLGLASGGARKNHWFRSFRLGLPEAFGAAADYLATLFAFVIVAWHGAESTAMARFGFVILTTAFFVAQTVASAVQTYGSQLIGRKRLPSFGRVGRFLLSLALVLGTLAGALLYCLDHYIVLAMAGSPQPNFDAEAMIDLVSLLFPVICLCSLSVALLRAQKRTDSVVSINLACIWLIQIPSLLIMIEIDIQVAHAFLLCFALYFLARSLINVLLLGPPVIILDRVGLSLRRELHAEPGD